MTTYYTRDLVREITKSLPAIAAFTLDDDCYWDITGTCLQLGTSGRMVMVQLGTADGHGYVEVSAYEMRPNTHHSGKEFWALVPGQGICRDRPTDREELRAAAEVAVAYLTAPAEAAGQSPAQE